VKRLETGAALFLFALTAALYAAGASRADPGTGLARSDLEVLRHWKESGRIEDLAGDPSHLVKPGYLIYLRAMLPHEGKDASEVRRFLAVNAIAVLCGLGAAALALARRSGSRATILFLVFGLLYLPARDSADYVGSEPLAIGVSLLFFAALLGARPAGPGRAILLGLACAGILLLRPNLGWILLAAGLVALAGNRETRLAASTGLLAGFVAGSALLYLAGRSTGLPINPLRSGGSRVLLWGTANYYWAPDVGGWPVGKTPEESARLQLEKTRERWKELLTRRNTDTARSLLWRATHSLLSGEQLPARWSARGYLRADRFLREWWWLAAAGLFGAAAAFGGAGSGEFRFVPLLLLVACIAQGIVFGADPRLTLPFIPLVALSLAASRPGRFTARQTAAGLLATAMLLSAAAAVPDTANSDFAVLRGPGRSLEQVIAASRFPASETATLHLRLVKPDGIGLGLTIKGNGEPLYERAPEDVSATPAFLSLVLRGPTLSRARLQGLKLEAETFGSSRAADAFFYFPATPPVFRPGCLMDGSEDLASGYGGTTRGSVPAWIHPGLD
jgi:hypothetical protein